MSAINSLQSILLVIASSIILALLGFIIFGDRGVMDLYELRREREYLIAENVKLKRINSELTQFIERLEKEDPELIERIARDELGLVREGEIVIIPKGSQK